MKKGRICIRTKNGLSFYNVSDIVFCEAFGRYTYMNTTSNRILITENLKKVESRLDKRQFIRTHQSYLVNVDFISEYFSKSNELKLLNNDMIKVSIRNKKTFVDKVYEYYK